MTPTAADVGAALRQAGVIVAPDEIAIEPRDNGRAMVRLPGDRLAWFPTAARGADRLAVERRILRLVAARCSFQAPRVLHEAAAGWDLRSIVVGATDAWDLYGRATVDTALAARIGRALGAILLEQHTRIGHADVAGWIPTQLGWPEPNEWIRARLPRVVDDAGLLRGMDAVLDAYADTAIAAEDQVLVHGDVGFHNIAVDPVTSQVRGIFDYDGAAWTDRHHDFRSLLFDRETTAMLDAALAVYEPAVGRTLSRARIRLYNAVCAISYLASRDGVPADRRWCGRTLAEDLAWVRLAIARL